MSEFQAPIQVIGIGMDGATGLRESLRQQVNQAQILVGSNRHLSYFPESPAQRLVLGDLTQAIDTIQQHLTQSPVPSIVILVSGDPLFFGLGRLLLESLPAEMLEFHPHPSSVQLAFSRIKVPWQDAVVVSAHGRSLDALLPALRQHHPKIAILTDRTHSPPAIARLVQSLQQSIAYKIWVCENLGSSDEIVTAFTTNALAQQSETTFAALNVVILHQDVATSLIDVNSLPMLGIPDDCFASFRDRPGLITKREVRVLALAELKLQPHQIVWDIGAGTGSVAVEMARLCPTSQVYAIETTQAGLQLIQENQRRFQIENLYPILGTAPEILSQLPAPDRIFIGGNGGRLPEILEACDRHLHPSGVIVLALATLNHLTEALTWIDAHPHCSYRLLAAQLSRSVPLASLQRLSPLNPVNLITLKRSLDDAQPNVRGI